MNLIFKLLRLAQLGNVKRYYVTAEPIATAFWRTLMTDRKGHPMARFTEKDIKTINPRPGSLWSQSLVSPKNFLRVHRDILGLKIKTWKRSGWSI